MLNAIKWAATFTLIVSVGLNGLGFYPTGVLLQIGGGILWTIASIKMGDKPLIATNVIMTLVGITAVSYNYFVGV